MVATTQDVVSRPVGREPPVGDLGCGFNVSTDINTPCQKNRTVAAKVAANEGEGEVARLRVSIGGAFVQKDGVWKYVGGETFLESVPMTWRYADLVFCLAEKVDGAISVKYLLPGEELDPDALISVSDDSDIVELFGEYERALRLPGTPIKTFRLRIFLFPAAEDPYTPEDLEAEARYAGMDLSLFSFRHNGSSSRLASATTLCEDASEASSSAGEGKPGFPGNLLNPLPSMSGVLDAEFMEGIDGIHTPSTVPDTELAWEAGFMAGQEAALVASDERWAELVRLRVEHLAGHYPAPDNTLGGPMPSTQVTVCDPKSAEMDLEFQSMFETKYEIVSNRSSSQQKEKLKDKQTAEEGQGQHAENGISMGESLSQVTAGLPTHISIFGDEVDDLLAMAAVRDFGPSPAAAANLPSHISEFGGSDYDCPELRMTMNERSLRSPPQEAADLLPLHFKLVDGSLQTGMHGPPALPVPPAGDVLLRVHHVDLDSLTVLAKIGEGSFGEVSLCNCGTFGRVAVKWIKSTKVERWESFWREAELMSRLNHPNVLRFFGLVTQRGGENVVGIMTEFAGGGSLAAFMRRGRGGGGCGNGSGSKLGGGGGRGGGGGSDVAGGGLPLAHRVHLALHAVQGVAYLHSQKVVHFDIKPDNLLVDGDWTSAGGPTLKVADFGLSVVKANTFCSDVHDLRGTLPYMAPEMVTDHRHVTEAADVWSLGVVFWELLTQEQPYANIAPARLLGALGSGSARLPIPEWCEPEWRALMEACWIEDPTLRPTCRQLVAQLQRIRDFLGGV